MNKFKFINTLLNKEKFNPNQKERFLKLVSKELEGSFDTDIKILQGIEEIKVMLGTKKTEQNSSKSPDIKILSADFLADVHPDSGIEPDEAYFAECVELSKIQGLSKISNSLIKYTALL